MNNKILVIAIVILTFSFDFFLYINIAININDKNNKAVIDKFNNIFLNKTLEILNDDKIKLPIMEIDNTDYIGIIGISNNDLLLPIQSKCDNQIFKMVSNCNYSSGSSLVILGNIFKNSFSSVDLYSVGDEITFTNMLGKMYQYKVKKIKRTSDLNNLVNYDEDLIIVIKDYYDMEYVLLLCNSY